MRDAFEIDVYLAALGARNASEGAGHLRGKNAGVTKGARGEGWGESGDDST